MGTSSQGEGSLHATWTIRDATADDIDHVLELWDAGGGPPSVSDTREGLRRLLTADPRALLLAEVDDLVVGSLIAAWDGWRGSFYRLVVRSDRRRQGIAMALLREGERHLQTQGAVRLTAIVADEDPAAVGFWKAAGYRRQHDRARFVRPAR
jgi:ribosomal protein S18 acetylase RimI-like enzyme